MLFASIGRNPAPVQGSQQRLRAAELVHSRKCGDELLFTCGFVQPPQMPPFTAQGVGEVA